MLQFAKVKRTFFRGSKNEQKISYAIKQGTAITRPSQRTPYCFWRRGGWCVKFNEYIVKSAPTYGDYRYCLSVSGPRSSNNWITSSTPFQARWLNSAQRFYRTSDKWTPNFLFILVTAKITGDGLENYIFSTLFKHAAHKTNASSSACIISRAQWTNVCEYHITPTIHFRSWSSTSLVDLHLPMLAGIGPKTERDGSVGPVIVHLRNLYPRWPRRGATPRWLEPSHIRFLNWGRVWANWRYKAQGECKELHQVIRMLNFIWTFSLRSDQVQSPTRAALPPK